MKTLIEQIRKHRNVLSVVLLILVLSGLAGCAICVITDGNVTVSQYVHMTVICAVWVSLAFYQILNRK